MYITVTMDGVVRNMKARISNVGMEMCTDTSKLNLTRYVLFCFTDDTFAISEFKRFAKIIK